MIALQNPWLEVNPALTTVINVLHLLLNKEMHSTTSF